MYLTQGLYLHKFTVSVNTPQDFAVDFTQFYFDSSYSSI